MKSTIRLHLNGTDELEVNVGTFPGGEIRVKVNNPWAIQAADKVVISVQLKCAGGIQALAQLKSIVDHYGPVDNVALYMGYVPYARQDRVCSMGEANSIKVFANQINAMNFNKVITVDNHSDVSTALINLVANMNKADLFENIAIPFQNYDVFVAPDVGAAKEVEDLAIKYGKTFIQGLKKRDPSTGKLSGFSHISTHGALDGKSVLIIDDLCDGGGTFLGLAGELTKWHNMKDLGLYVTHGVFSKGTKMLTTTFDKVYTTDTLVSYNGHDHLGDVEVIKILSL